jgi:hypothetical protein
MITWTKLKNGDWGLRSTSQLLAGSSVNVTKKDGTTKSAVVGREIWNGNGVWLYSVEASRTEGRSRGYSRQDEEMYEDMGWGPRGMIYSRGRSR